jgi:Rieske Fe-S protein
MQFTHTQKGSENRRAVLLYLLGATSAALAAAVLYPIVRFLIPPEMPGPKVNSVLAGTKQEMTPNSGKIFRFGDKPGILVETPEGEIRAFTAVCTHLDCTVQYREDMQMIWCACHNGHYNLNGINIQGPPPRPLEQYKVSFVGGDIYATKQN